MKRVIALLLLVPLLDVLVLGVLAVPTVGWKVTVLIVVLTALLGTLLVRAEGRHTLRRIQEQLAEGTVPTDELVDGGFLIAAGAFFLTPGLVTDTIGFLLALPPTRAPIRALSKKYVIVPYLERKTDGFVSGEVYVGGFPDEEGGFAGGMGGVGPGGPGPGPGTPGPGGVGPESPGPGGPGDVTGGFDPDEATDIDFEESDDGSAEE